VRDVGAEPVVAQMTIQEDGATVTARAELLTPARRVGRDVIGLNCSVGPHGMLAAIEQMAAVATRSRCPRSRTPGCRARSTAARCTWRRRNTWRSSRRADPSGAKFVGGCCGTTPEHIKRMADARARDRAAPDRVSPCDVAAGRAGVRTAKPLASARTGAARSRGRARHDRRDRAAEGHHARAHARRRALLKAAGVDAVNVPDGPRAQMRMGVLPTATLVEQVVGIETVVHYCCRDRNLLGMLSDLLGAHALGCATCCSSPATRRRWGRTPRRRRSSTSTRSA
jgi:methionine synthase / methylenetetrahydrofolate reductase(NADPH)